MTEKLGSAKTCFLDQEVLCHLNDGALLVPPCLYNPIIVMLVFHNLRLISSGQELGATVLP